MSGVAQTLQRLRAQATLRTSSMGAGAGRMVWHVWGQSSAEHAPLVLLHGGSGSWTHWVRNIDALLAAGRQLWLPDLPGFGDSDLPPAGCDADAMVAPLYAGLRELLGGRSCDLVGFSFGGLSAGLFAAQHPHALQRLVLVGAPAMDVLPARPYRLLGWRHLRSEQAQLRVHRHNLQVLMLSDPALIDAETLALHVANVVRDRMPRRRLANTNALALALARVRCPVYAIYGEQDALYSNAMPALEAAFYATGASFQGLKRIAASGHWVQYQSPQEFDAALAQALV